MLLANLILKACGMDCLHENEVAYLKIVKLKPGNLCEKCEELNAKSEELGPPDLKRPRMDSMEYCLGDEKWHRIDPAQLLPDEPMELPAKLQVTRLRF